MRGISVLDPGDNSPEARVARRIKELETRLDELEERARTVPVTTAAPTADARDGSMVAVTTPRLWVRINGTWRFVALT